MIATEKILPIKEMLGQDWDKIHSGFVITGSRDWHTPKENSFSEQVIEYLLNIQLQISDYSQYDKFCFYVTTYVAEPIYYHPEGVNITDEYGEKWCTVEVYMPDAKRFSEVNKHDALQMTAQLLLESVPKYLFHREDFDGEKFYEDILPIIKPIADGTRTFRDEEFPM